MVTRKDGLPYTSLIVPVGTRPDGTEGADVRMHTVLPNGDLVVTGGTGARSGLRVEITVSPNGRVKSISVTASDELAHGLSSRAIRDIPVEAFRKYAVVLAENSAEREACTPDNAGSAALKEFVRLRAELPRPGVAGRDDSFYLPVAVRYAELVHDGSTSPVDDIAGEWNLSAKTVRNYVHECRPPRRNLLTDAPRGRAGGQLTEKAKTLLSSAPPLD